MRLQMRDAALLLVAASTLAATSALAAPRQSAGTCGENMYWHHGKCEDAREKTGKTWSQDILSKAWKP
jgi:hypothetical protein